MNRFVMLNTVHLQAEEAAKAALPVINSRRGMLNHLGEISHANSLSPEGVNRRIDRLNCDDFVQAAKSRMNGRVPLADGIEIERLRIRAAELEVSICGAVNGERARLETMRSDCLKALGQMIFAGIFKPNFER